MLFGKSTFDIPIEWDDETSAYLEGSLTRMIERPLK